MLPPTITVGLYKINHLTLVFIHLVFSAKYLIFECTMTQLIHIIYAIPSSDVT